MVLLTSIIIFAGVWASWTVKERSQEFYALLAPAGDRRLRRLRLASISSCSSCSTRSRCSRCTSSIGIWGSSGRGRARRASSAGRSGRTGVGTKEYAAMKLTLYLLFGSRLHPGRHPRALRGGGSSSLLVPRDGADAVRRRGLQSWVFLAFYVGFGILAGIWPLHTWSPDGHASAPTAVSMLHAGVLMKLGAYGVVRLGMGLLPDGTHQWMWLVGAHRLRQHRLRRALAPWRRSDLKYVIAVLVGLAHGRGDAGRGHAHRDRAQRLGVPDVRPRAS